MTLKGYVTGYEMADGLVQTILVRDSEGKIARVFIDGYITTSYECGEPVRGLPDLRHGLASYDNTFVLADGTAMAPRIRVRDRNDVVCTAHEHTFGEWIVTTSPPAPSRAKDPHLHRLRRGGDHGHRRHRPSLQGWQSAPTAAQPIPATSPTQPGVKTGDESNTTMWIIVLVCAAALAVVLVIVSRKSATAEKPGSLSEALKKGVPPSGGTPLSNT